MTAVLAELVVVLYNAKTGRHRTPRVVAEVRRLVREHRPDVLLLQEARHFWVALRVALFLTHRVVVAPSINSRARNCVIVVRRDRPVRVLTPWRFAARWTGPKHGHDQPPRVFPGIVVGGWVVYCDHWIRRLWGKVMFREQAPAVARMLRLAEEHLPGLPVIFGGDKNHTAVDRSHGTPAWVAAQHDGRCVTPGQGVDWLLCFGATGTARRLPKMSSDHAPVLARLHPIARAPRHPARPSVDKDWADPCNYTGGR